jgi:hypothetical protein
MLIVTVPPNPFCGVTPTISVELAPACTVAPAEAVRTKFGSALGDWSPLQPKNAIHARATARWHVAARITSIGRGTIRGDVLQVGATADARRATFRDVTMQPSRDVAR